MASAGRVYWLSRRRQSACGPVRVIREQAAKGIERERAPSTGEDASAALFDDEEAAEVNRRAPVHATLSRASSS